MQMGCADPSETRRQKRTLKNNLKHSQEIRTGTFVLDGQCRGDSGDDNMVVNLPSSHWQVSACRGPNFVTCGTLKVLTYPRAHRCLHQKSPVDTPSWCALQRALRHLWCGEVLSSPASWFGGIAPCSRAVHCQ